MLTDKSRNQGSIIAGDGYYYVSFLMFSSGWGAALGFPVLILDPVGTSVDVDLFESMDLPEHWARLDEFEGSSYRRVVATVNTEEGERAAWIYVLAEEA